MAELNRTCFLVNMLTILNTQSNRMFAQKVNYVGYFLVSVNVLTNVQSE